MYIEIKIFIKPFRFLSVNKFHWLLIHITIDLKFWLEIKKTILIMQTISLL